MSNLSYHTPVHTYTNGINAVPAIEPDKLNSQLTVEVAEMHKKVKELEALKKRVAELEASEAIYKQTEETLRNNHTNLLKQEKVSLLTTSEIKNEFLANMSHEVRTPLNSIIGLTGLLFETQLNEDQREYTKTIRTNGDILLSLVNNILDFSKIEAHKIDLESSPFELRLCIEEALEVVAQKAIEKNLELTYGVEDQLPSTFIGDFNRLRQIMVNLLDNAVKFTEQGEVVAFVEGTMLGTQKYQLHFSVKDSGIGISKEEMDKLFQSFTQADSSTTRKYGGTGLGLAISKSLCELMKGTMWVESTGISGEGSTFHFTIQIDVSSAVRSKNDQSILIGKKVLIVDDNETNREILKMQTQALHMYPTTAESGIEALKLIKDNTFDLGILDFQMPEMNGVMLADEIRKLKENNSFPLVLLSSLGKYVEKIDNKVFAAALEKPVKSIQLCETLVEALTKAERERKKQAITLPTSNSTLLANEHPLTILLAEDNKVNQIVALRFLEKLGYKADAVMNGEEVLDAMEKKEYDLILMDIQMPVMDGNQTTIEIRKRFPQERQPRIVALTANAMPGDREKGLALGMNEYMTKPFAMEDLMKTLKETQPLGQQPQTAIAA